MSLPVIAGVTALGGLGAVLRLLLDDAVSERAGGTFPFGTLAVNLSGSLALGILAGAAIHGASARLWETGLIGAFTTFSTWVYESRQLAETGEPAAAALNLAGSVLAGVLLAWLGTKLGARL